MRTMTAAAALALVFVTGTASAATVDGIDLHWTSSGAGPRTLILVHGWTCDATSWQAQVADLARDHRVITLDLPGHGRSGPPRDGRFSMDLFARAVDAVRAEAKVDRAVLVGHSMGTPVVREYALKFPQHVAALVLVDGLVQVAGRGAAPAPAAMTGANGLRARETMVRGMFGRSTTPALQQQILTMMLGTEEATAQGAMAATWDPAHWKNDPVHVPVLAVYADGSRLANRDGLALLYPHHEYHEIAGAAHFLMMEKPAEFNALVRTFAAGVK